MRARTAAVGVLLALLMSLPGVAGAAQPPAVHLSLGDAGLSLEGPVPDVLVSNLAPGQAVALTVSTVNRTSSPAAMAVRTERVSYTGDATALRVRIGSAPEQSAPADRCRWSRPR